MDKGTSDLTSFEHQFYNHIILPLHSDNDLSKLSNTLEQLLPLLFAESEDRPVGIHPSELPGCLRKAYYSLVGADKKAPKLMEPRLYMGSAIHKLIQDRFRDTSFYTVKKEIPISNSEFARRFLIVGSCDMGFYINGKPVLGVEIKSGIVPEFPMSHHIMQATIYQAALEFPSMWYFYLSREMDKWKCFILGKPNIKVVADIEARCYLLLQHFGGLNPPDPEPNWFVCNKICAYKHHCNPRI